MSGIIHITKRKNLLYAIYLMLCYFFRMVDLKIINEIFQFNDSLIFTLLMLFGDFFTGFGIFLYQFCSFKNKNKNTQTAKYLGIVLLQYNARIKRPDSPLIILLLIFFTAFFDFVEFIIATFYMPKYSVLSPTSEIRLGGGILL